VSDPDEGDIVPGAPGAEVPTDLPATPGAEATAGTRAAAKAALKKRLGQTTIGIAPPAIGSKAPPRRAAEPEPQDDEVPPIKRTLRSAPPLPAAKIPSVPPIPAAAPLPGALAARGSKPPLAPANPASTPPPVVDDTPVGGSPPRLASRPPTGGSGPASPAAKVTKTGGSTLLGTAPPPPLPGPAPIIPRRRTPAGGLPAVAPVGQIAPKVTPLGSVIPRAAPLADAPLGIDATNREAERIIADVLETSAARAADVQDAAVPTPRVAKDRVHVGSIPVGVGSVPPPVIRVPQGGLLGGSTQKRHDRSGTLLCEILVKNGEVTQEMVDKALALQEERGGQIGRILVSLGACSENAIARGLIEQLRVRKDEGFLSDISAAARERKDVVGLKVLTRPTRTVAVLLLTDVFSLLLAALLATAVHWARTYSELQAIDWTAWLVVGPAIALCLLTFLGLELYSPMSKSTPDEIRDIVFAASLVHLGASVLSTLGDLPIVKWGVLVRSVWWGATLFLVPVIRSLVRNYFSVQPWWGIPVCVLGAAKTGRLVVRTLKAQPRSGLKPVMLLDDDMTKFGTLRASFTNEVMDVYSVNVSAAHFLTEAQRSELSADIFGDDEDERASAPISSDHIPIAPEAWRDRVDVKITAPTPRREPPVSQKEFFNPDSKSLTRSQITKDASQFPRGKFAEVDGVPLVGDLSLAPVLAQRLNIPYAVVAMPGVESQKLVQIVERIGGKFSHLLIIPDLFGFATMGVPAKSLGGILGVEVRQQLLLPGPRLAKRCIDVFLTVLGGIFVLPFLALIALLIKLDSKGPVFYKQNRLGKDGTYFSAYKFRSMHGDGEARLKAVLDADPALRAEYDIYHKLRKDPRVTRIGRVLRKFSLDEFPQLLNVLKGDMSLVGPRPYLERELTDMGGQEKIVLRAPPGMTGMWQVSDRNAMPFAQRVQIDVYYVRNWSPWLDIHILAKTFGVVVKGSGV
jgi:lipopolysaccharide/colanic/teichoic acid biosynthesis glycosyltransferase